MCVWVGGGGVIVRAGRGKPGGNSLPSTYHDQAFQKCKQPWRPDKLGLWYMGGLLVCAITLPMGPRMSTGKQQTSDFALEASL